MSLGCLCRCHSLFYNRRILSILIRYDFRVMILLNRILVRILSWDPLLLDVVRICQDLAMAIKMLVRGSTRGKVIFNKIKITILCQIEAPTHNISRNQTIFNLSTLVFENYETRKPFNNLVSPSLCRKRSLNNILPDECCSFFGVLSYYA